MVRTWSLSVLLLSLRQGLDVVFVARVAPPRRGAAGKPPCATPLRGTLAVCADGRLVLAYRSVRRGAASRRAWLVLRSIRRACPAAPRLQSATRRSLPAGNLLSHLRGEWGLSPWHSCCFVGSAWFPLAASRRYSNFESLILLSGANTSLILILNGHHTSEC